MMDFRWFLLFLCVSHSQQADLKFSIQTTWNGDDLVYSDIPVNITLSLASNQKGLQMDVVAPFYNDPPPEGEPGLPFMGLWDYEVVEAFFINDYDHYLEVEIGPYGQHIVLLFNGERNTIRHSLPLEVTTEIQGNIWTGSAIIPMDYLPYQTTDFNAHAIHGVEPDRFYSSLYPANIEQLVPDFHNLSLFKPIDLKVIDPSLFSLTKSEIWEAALDGIIRYTVSREWNQANSLISTRFNSIDSHAHPSQYSLQGFQGGVEMNFTIIATEDYPFNYTVFKFENVLGEAIKITLKHTGESDIQFLHSRGTLMTSDMEVVKDYGVQVVKSEDPLKTITKGSVLVSPEYFPPNVTLLNIYVVFGKEDTTIDALEPINDQAESAKPNLENLKHFITIDFDNLVESNTKYSSLWFSLLSNVPSKTSAFRTNRILPSDLLPANKIVVSQEKKINTKLQKVLPTKMPVEITTYFTTTLTDVESVTTVESLIEMDMITLSEEISKIKNHSHAVEKLINAEIKNVNTESENLKGTSTTATVFETTITPTENIIEHEEVTTVVNDERFRAEPLFKEIKVPAVELTTTLNAESTTVQNLEAVPTEANLEQQITTENWVEENTANKANKEQQIITENWQQGKSADKNIELETTTQLFDLEEITTQQFDQEEITTQQFDQEETTLSNWELTSTGNWNVVLNNNEIVQEVKKAQPIKQQTEFIIKSINEQPVQLFEGPAPAAIPVPSGFWPELNDQQFGRPLAHFSSPRETFQRRFEETNRNKNVLPINIKLLINTEKKFEEPSANEQSLDLFDYIDPSTDAEIQEFVDQSDYPFNGMMEDGPQLTPDIESALEDVFDILTHDQADNERIEAALDSLVNIGNIVYSNNSDIISSNNGTDIILPESVNDIENSIIDSYDEFIASNILPPPHPICFVPGLVPDPYRCQVFYECVLENGKWEVYDWRCKRGHYFDSKKVACLRGFC